MLYDVINHNNQSITPKALCLKALDYLLQMLYDFLQNFFICNLLFISIIYYIKPILLYFIKKAYNIYNKSKKPRNNWANLLHIKGTWDITSYNIYNKSLLIGGYNDT
jgi:hypothetical protein